MIENEDGTPVVEKAPSEYTLDIISIRMLAIVVCRGTFLDKANAFYKVLTNVVPKRGSNVTRGKICWSDVRLKKSMRVLISVAELFPRMFYE